MLEQSWREWARCSATLLDTCTGEHKSPLGQCHFRNTDPQACFACKNYLKLLFLRIRPQKMVTLVFLSLYIILVRKANYAL